MDTTETVSPGTDCPSFFDDGYGSPSFYRRKLEEIFEVSEGQSLHFVDLIERVRSIRTDANRQLVLERLESMAQSGETAASGVFTPLPRRLPESRQICLAQVLSEVVVHADHLPSRDRDRADRAVARLSRLLTSERAWCVVQPWFGDLRAFRRSVVIRVLREHGVPPTLASDIMIQYRATGDRELLKLISRNPHVAALLEESDIELVLAQPTRDRQWGPINFIDTDTRYWRMRAIEAYLIGGHVLSVGIATAHPMEFVWAVGRQAHRNSLPLLRYVLDCNQSNPEFIWRCMRAFDRVGDIADIDHVRSLGFALVTQCSSLSLPPSHQSAAYM